MKRTPETGISPFDANGDEIVIDAEAKNVRDRSKSTYQKGRGQKHRQIKEVKVNQTRQLTGTMIGRNRILILMK